MANTKRNVASLCLFLVLLSIFFLGNRLQQESPSTIYAQENIKIESAPTNITYQGYIAENGTPASGTYSMAFALYNSLDGGTAIASLPESSVAVNGGLFSVELTFDSSVWDTDVLYLQVTINSEEMKPRQKITSVPFAIQAGSVDWNGITNVPSDLGNGQTWTGSHSGTGVLTLENTSSASRSSGLRIIGAGDDAIRIETAGESGVWVGNVVENGLQVDQSSTGVFVSRAQFYGIHIDNHEEEMKAAGRFDGDIVVLGSICTGLNGFDPADCTPASSLLSTDTIQSGNVELNSSGEATISLPDVFTTAFSEFSYQLTPIGSFSQLYISQEIEGSSFTISGGNAAQKVSWQVTGLEN